MWGLSQKSGCRIIHHQFHKGPPPAPPKRGNNSRFSQLQLLPGFPQPCRVVPVPSRATSDLVPKRWIFLAAPWWRHLSFLLLYFSENPNFSDPFPSKYVPVASLWVSDSQKFWGPIHKISIHGISWMDLVCRTPQPLRLRLTMHQDTHGSGRSQGPQRLVGSTWNIASF